MFLTSPETDKNCRRRWSLKTTVSTLAAMLLTSAGLAILPTTAAAADAVSDAQADLTSAQTAAAEALTAYEIADANNSAAEEAVKAAKQAVKKAEKDVEKPKRDEDPVALAQALVEAQAALVTATNARDAVPGGTADLLTTAKIALEKANSLVLEKQAALDAATAAAAAPPPSSPPAEETTNEDKPTGEGDGIDEGTTPPPTPNETTVDEGGKEHDHSKHGKPGHGDKCELPAITGAGAQLLGGGDEQECEVPPKEHDHSKHGKPGHGDKCEEPASIDSATQLSGGDAGKGKNGDKECEEPDTEPGGPFNGNCDRPSNGGDMSALDRKSAEEYGEKWEKDCYIRPVIDIKVENRCPTVVVVEISNLKRWLDYKVKVNGEWVELDVDHGTATIEVDDFESGKLGVLVKYEKKWKKDHKSWDSEKKWGKGGAVFEKKRVKEYTCPVIDTEVEKKCNKIDGKTKVEIQVTELDDDRKYLVTVEGDDYKKHFWVEGEDSFYKDLKLREGDYTVTVESWAKKGGGDWGGAMSVQGGGGDLYDNADIGPVVYEFTVEGCPVDVVVEPTENCKAITAVLDTLVEGREYIVKVKNSEGDVVFEKTVWGPTTLDQKFQQDTYTVIVIDVKAKKYGDRNGGWGGDNDHYNPWKDREKENEVLLTAVVGDEFAYDKDWGKDDEEWNNDDDGHAHDHDKKGKKGKGLKWTATITLSDCPEPPTVEPAGETPDNGGNGGYGPSPSVGGNGGGGVLATTGADPAGLALAALILLPVGGAVLATRSVVARRKNAA